MPVCTGMTARESAERISIELGNYANLKNTLNYLTRAQRISYLWQHNQRILTEMSDDSQSTASGLQCLYIFQR